MADSPAPNPLEVQQLTVEFPGVRALDNVSLNFRPAEVHGIIGENGAGKSTLMKTLAGLQRPTQGTVLIDGEPVQLRGAADATARGVAMIHQELNLIDELSVAENLLLGREPRTAIGTIDRSKLHADARRWLDASGGQALDTHERLGSLSVAQQQTVEIAKAVSQEARVIIMDEPTAVLGERESEALFAVIRRLREEGRTVLYISHRLAEVRELCDRISVLRDGQYVTTLEGEDRDRADPAKLASLMVGRQMGEMSEHFPPRKLPRNVDGFEVRGVSVPPLVSEVSFSVKQGEIFGLAGLIGAGRTELAEGLVGLRLSTGEVLVHGEPIRHRRVADAMRGGLVYLSEDRKAAGLVLELGIAANTTLATLRRYCNPAVAGPAGMIDFKAEKSVAGAHATNLRTKYARLRDSVSTLSGGNQQKVALAKWLDANPKVLILDEPTRGVDVGAKEEIYRVIARLAAEGLACVVISSELPELLGLCHRIGVFAGGRLVEVIDHADATEENIMHAAAGIGSGGGDAGRQLVTPAAEAAPEHTR